MKKIWISFITLLLSLAMCVGICACNKTKAGTISVTVNGQTQTSGGTFDATVGTAYTIAATASNKEQVSISYVFDGETKTLTDSAFTPEKEGNYAFTFTAKKADTFKLTVAAAKHGTPEQQCTVTFGLGDHSASDAAAIAARTVVTGTVITLPAAPKAANGYDFDGWSDGLKKYSEGASYTVNSTVTLTAVWKAQKVTVSYSLGDHAAEGATAPVSQAVDINSDIQLPDAVPAASGYEFGGWSDGSKTYGELATYNVKSEVSFTAVYNAQGTVTKYTVSYSLGDHAAADASVPTAQTVNAGISITLPEAPQAAGGYNFDGWSVGTDKYNAKESYTVNATVTLTALWAIDQQGGVINGNFETGDLTGWTVVSGTGAHAVNVKTYWDDDNKKDMNGKSVSCYLQTGEYFLITDGAGQEKEVTIKSTTFTLGGDGLITFKLGIAKNPVCYVALCDASTNEELVKVTNDYFKDPELAEVLLRRVMYANDYIGRNVYIKVVDEGTADFGFLNFDDLKVSLTISEVQAIISADKVWAATYRQDVLDWNAPADNIAKDIVNAVRDYYKKYLELIDINNIYWVQKIGDKAELADVKNINDYLSEARVSMLGVNASAFVKSIVSVNDVTSGFTSLNLEAGKTYTVTYRIAHPSDSSKYVEETFTITVTSAYEIINGDFETGNLNGWTIVEGNAFADVNVFGDTTYWGGKDYNQEGNFHLDGWQGANEPGTGIIRSSTFKLGGTGKISFRLGGNKDGRAYISVKKAGSNTEVARFVNTEWNESTGGAYMYVYVFDLTTVANDGDELYIEIVDTATTGDWGLVFVDDIRTYHTADTLVALGNYVEAVNKLTAA